MLIKFLNKLRTYKYKFIAKQKLFNDEKFARKNRKFIESLKNKHEGENCFIIGNGPSLKIEDLDKLKSAVTFASNKIFLAFESTTWRPNYYTVSDLIVAKNNSEKIKSLNLIKLLSSETLKVFKDKKAYYFNELMITLYHTELPYPFSKDASIGVNAGHTVIYNQLQLAFYMGFKNVYLIGVDYSFIIPKETKDDPDYKNVLINMEEINHFHPEYRLKGETWAKPDLDGQMKAFKMAENIYNEAGRKIWNASRQTKLDVFERTSLDNLLTKNI